MCGQTRLDKIRNKVIRNKVGVTFIEDKIREAKLRWLGYRRRSIDALVRKCERIVLPKCRRCRGRPRKSWNE